MGIAWAIFCLWIVFVPGIIIVGGYYAEQRRDRKWRERDLLPSPPKSTRTVQLSADLVGVWQVLGKDGKVELETMSELLAREVKKTLDAIDPVPVPLTPRPAKSFMESHGNPKLVVGSSCKAGNHEAVVMAVDKAVPCEVCGEKHGPNKYSLPMASHAKKCKDPNCLPCTLNYKAVQATLDRKLVDFNRLLKEL